MPAELAHGLAAVVLRFLSRLLPRRAPPVHDPIELWGKKYRNRLGLAAGFDKGAVYGNALFRLGFGFVEIGTVTPRPQSGNPKPRLFRLPRSRALINRMGFNNPGADAVAARLARWKNRAGPVWINVGKNKDTPAERAADDYASAVRTLAAEADVFVINVSSPNTPGLRDLQSESALRPIAERVLAEARGKPVLLKLAPDLADDAFAGIVALARQVGLAGLIATNTTIARPVSESSEAGGLSGAPLKPRALDVLKTIHAIAPDFFLVGVGGVSTHEDFMERRAAGATLVQGYTAFVYGGPSWPRRVLGVS